VKSVCDNHVLVKLMRVQIWATQSDTTDRTHVVVREAANPDPAFLPGTLPDLAPESGRTILEAFCALAANGPSRPDDQISDIAARPAEKWRSANSRRHADWRYLNGSILLTRAGPSEQGLGSAPRKPAVAWS
jgi:hypothetical protein